jgi:hypothetical protein
MIRQATYKKVVLQGYNELPLNSSIHKFYCRYNDLVHNYKSILAYMLNDLFHTCCYTVVPILVLTNVIPVYLISTKGSRRVWPVSIRSSLLRGTWSYLCICHRSVLPYTWSCNRQLDYDYVLHIVNLSILYCHFLLVHLPKLTLLDFIICHGDLMLYFCLFYFVEFNICIDSEDRA